MKNDKDMIKIGKHVDWNKIKCFYYIAKLGSITNAAHYLGITQPALSRKLSDLEYELGYKVCTRRSTALGITINRKGEEIISYAEHMLRGIQKTSFNTLKNANDKRLIRIATTQPIAAYILNEHLLNYNELNPNVEFEIDTNDHLLDLFINDVDIAIRPYDDSVKEVQQEYLFTLEKKLYASQKYIDKYGEPKNIEDLKNHHLIAYSRPEERPYSDLNWILKLGITNGELHKPVYTADSLECLVEATKRGVGIFACYENMNIIKHANLQVILPEIKGEKIDEYVMYPDYLKTDCLIIDFKNYLTNIL